MILKNVNLSTEFMPGMTTDSERILPWKCHLPIEKKYFVKNQSIKKNCNLYA